MSKFIIYTAFLSLFFLPVLGSGLNKNITVFSIGNGNMADVALTSNERGWMQMLPMFFGPNVHFNNDAIKHKSAKAFLSEGFWDAVLSQIKEGDYVFISFDIDLPATVQHEKEYGQTISRFFTDVMQKKGIPVLFASVHKLNKKNPSYSFVKKLAESKRVTFIDLENSTENNSLSISQAIKVAKAAAGLVKNKLPDFRTVQDGHETSDFIASNLKNEAAINFKLRQLPETKETWELYGKNLRSKLLKASGVLINHTLSLDYRETGSIKMKGYTIRKIYFQTRPNVYATANLYVPDGKGVFPAVINMHGHWENGKAGDMVQACAHELALNGYVCLNIDAWGSGERTTVHGIHEYHGSNLGASLMNIGESLLGNQLSDNIRGVDLLCSLPYVDKNNIGATGASGGGNQTMWLSAMDERIKAAMPVVSVGTFQSYIMGSNCVCELMPGGLTFTEESGVLAMVAPRALQVCNGLQDASPTFYPSEMLISYNNAKPIFELYHEADHINFQLFNTPHGYWPEMRQAMLSWFDLNLKGIKSAGFKEEIPFKLLSGEQLMVFPKGSRSQLVKSTAEYCIQKGAELSAKLYKQTAFNTDCKLKDLKDLLLLPAKPDAVTHVHEYGEQEGWHRFVLETKNKHLIGLKYYAATKGNVRTVILITSTDEEKKQQTIIRDYIQKGYTVVLADIWGTGENASAEARRIDGRLPEFHTLARSELWLRHTIMGEWVSDINDVIGYVQANLKPLSIAIDADKELAVAALIQSALHNNIDYCTLRNCPVSYTLKQGGEIDYFNMAIHLPGILNWGDVSLIAALNRRAKLIFKDLVSIKGENVTGKELAAYKEMFSKIETACNSKGSILFEN